MVDGRTTETGRNLPHIVLPGDAATERFQRRGGGGTARPLRTISDRAAHAARLRRELEEAIQSGQAGTAAWENTLRAEGLVLAVEGWPDFEIAVESLELRRSGIELLSVVPPSGEHPGRATIYVPDGRAEVLFGRLRRYAEEETTKGRPKHEDLVANIQKLSLAAIEQMWTDSAPLPEALDHRMWWELWLRQPGDELEVLAQIGEMRDWHIAANSIRFPGRTVAAAFATRRELADTLGSRLPIAELRSAHLVESPAQLPRADQVAWVAGLMERVEPAPPEAPAACLLDTGVYQHSLLDGSLDASDIHYVVGLDGIDRVGHGTEMAGIALFGDLEEALTAPPIPLALEHRLESVKLLPDQDQNEESTYTSVTARAIALPESVRPERRRAYCMATTINDGGSDGRPSSWSATVDALCFGTDVERKHDGSLELLTDPDPANSRLIILSAGNTRDGYCSEFLDLCDTSPVEDPAQAWNALTVGAYTDKAGAPDHPDFAGWSVLAAEGELSPISRTSVRFSRGWPVKPDIVMEGGNLIISPGGADFDTHDVVSVTTTSLREPVGQPLTTTTGTSPASAQAARLAAIAWRRYPAMWPESIRALLVHAAEWTPTMLTRIEAPGLSRSARLVLLRRYGFGVPTLERVLNSAAGDVTMIRQSQFRPFESVSGRGRLREMHLHELPWPTDVLRDLGPTNVRLRVTLSYYIEPNPSSRGWNGRYVYQSHGLRFDIRRPTESTAEFRVRLNAVAEAEEGAPGVVRGQEPNWMFGPQARTSGSLHADLWTGTAAELANCGLLGVYPVGGWWKHNNRADRMEDPVRYSLLVSLETEATEVDLYTPIATQVGVPIEVTG